VVICVISVSANAEVVSGDFGYVRRVVTKGIGSEGKCSQFWQSYRNEAEPRNLVQCGSPKISL
jgi:hypothetical protein